MLFTITTFTAVALFLNPLGTFDD